MTTLVTGAAGHVGANLVRALIARGESVRVLLHVNTEAIDGLDIDTVQGDVCRPETLTPAFHGVDTVYHLAACLSLTADKWQEMGPVNVKGTSNIVDACLRHKIRRLIHFSSIHALVPKSPEEIVDESCDLMTVSDWPPYGFSKAAGEKEIAKGIEQGLNAIIIRPTAILGPYDFQPSFFGEVLLSLAQGRLPGLVDGGFDWVDVRDVVEGAIQAGKTAPSGSEYLLSGSWASLCEVADMIANITGTGAPKFNCPLWLADLGAPLVSFIDRVRGKRPLYTSFSIKTLRASPHVSHEKATRELGYQPRPLFESIKDTLDWFHEIGQLDYPNKNRSGEQR